MSFDNLVKINRLQRHSATRASVWRLWHAAQRNLADEHVTNITSENRFDAAYKAILQCAMAALWANGYRTPTSIAGHHATAIQTLPLSIGLDNSRVIVLDALRKQRNLADYEGDSITDAALTECMQQAQDLLQYTKEKLVALIGIE